MVRSMIAWALSQAYPGVAIYKEQASVIERPAFYIGEIAVDQSRLIGNRYNRDHDMVVRYFPAQDDNTAYVLLSEIADKLYATLDWLDFDGHRGRGMDMRHRIEDNVLQFYVTVRLRLMLPGQDVKMEHIDKKFETKG